MYIMKSSLHLNRYYKESLQTDKEAINIINQRDTRSDSLSLCLRWDFVKPIPCFSFHFPVTMLVSSTNILYPSRWFERWALADLVSVQLSVTSQAPCWGLLSSLADLKGMCVSSTDALLQFLTRFLKLFRKAGFNLNFQPVEYRH